MKKTLFTLTIFILTIFTAQAQTASVPQLINYQGMLTDASGQPMETKEYKLSFSIFTQATGGTAVWGPQVFAKAPVVRGHFNVILGPKDTTGRNITDAFASDNTYLEITIDNGNPVEPRQQILSAPYAMHAQQAEKLKGLDRTDSLETAGANKVGTFDTFDNSSSANVQNVLKDFDQAIVKTTSKIDSTYKLLAASSDWTEEALFKITSSGITVETDQAYDAQHVNPVLFNWPSEDIHEIVFEVTNYGDGYCVGGDGVLDISGSSTRVYARCTDYYYKGETVTKKTKQEKDWIRLKINGKNMDSCPNQLERTPQNGYPGAYGHPYFNCYCIYSKNAGHWSDKITQFEVEEADWSDDFGRWEWKIWYR
ncbi:MAG: hypothetical protein GY749_33780 [Desulfobacteraceae bacterium]|nr:hypothetical protein [Desulfobacteraceae bacterium]